MNNDKLTNKLIDVVRKGEEEAPRKLSARGADPRHKDSWLLRLALSNEQPHLVRFLMDHCDAAAQDSAALRLAAEKGMVDCVQWLLPLSDPKALDSKALVLAARHGHLEVVRLLVPVSSICDSDGDIPEDGGALDAALYSGQPEILQCILNGIRSHETNAIDYDFWLTHLWSAETKYPKNITQMAKVFDPIKNLKQKSAERICQYDYHALDNELACLVLERSQIKKGDFPFVTQSEKYKFLKLAAILGRQELLEVFFAQENTPNTQYMLDLMGDIFNMWDVTQVKSDMVVKGMAYIVSLCCEDLASLNGDKLLVQASASGSEDVFKIFLPHCNLERAYANAQGTSKDLELIEHHNALRLKDILDQHVRSSGSTNKRKM